MDGEASRKKTAQRFLRDLPVSLEEELPGGRKLLVVHGSPIVQRMTTFIPASPQRT